MRMLGRVFPIWSRPVGSRSIGSSCLAAPSALGQRLFEMAPEPKAFEVIPGARHNDTTFVGGRPYFERIGRFLDEVAPEVRVG